MKKVMIFPMAMKKKIMTWTSRKMMKMRKMRLKKRE